MSEKNSVSSLIASYHYLASVHTLIDYAFRDQLYELNHNARVQKLVETFHWDVTKASAVLYQVCPQEIPLPLFMRTGFLLGGKKVAQAHLLQKMKELDELKDLPLRTHRVLTGGRCLTRYKKQWPELRDCKSLTVLRPGSLRRLNLTYAHGYGQELCGDHSKFEAFTINPGDLGTRLFLISDPDYHAVLNRAIGEGRLKVLRAHWKDVVRFGDVIELIEVDIPGVGTVFFVNDGQARTLIASGGMQAHTFMALIHTSPTWELISKRICASKNQNPIKTDDEIHSVWSQSCWGQVYQNCWADKFLFQYGEVNSGMLVNRQNFLAAVINTRAFLANGVFPQEHKSECTHLCKSTILKELSSKELSVEEADSFFEALTWWLSMTSKQPKKRHTALTSHRHLTMAFLFYLKYAPLLPVKEMSRVLGRWEKEYRGGGGKDLDTLKEMNKCSASREKGCRAREQTFWFFAMRWLEQSNFNRRNDAYTLLEL